MHAMDVGYIAKTYQLSCPRKKGNY